MECIYVYSFLTFMRSVNSCSLNEYTITIFKSRRNTIQRRKEKDIEKWIFFFIKRILLHTYLHKINIIFNFFFFSFEKMKWKEMQFNAEAS